MFDKIAWFFSVNKKDFDFYCTYFWTVSLKAVFYISILIYMANVLVIPWINPQKSLVGVPLHITVIILFMAVVAYLFIVFVSSIFLVNDTIVDNFLDAVKKYISAVQHSTEDFFIAVINKLDKVFTSILNKFCKRIDRT
jgi:hypothetical protein